MPRQDDLNAVFTNEVTDLKAQCQTLNDVLNVMDWAVESTLEQLEASGTIPAEVGLLEEYRRAIKTLRKQGFRPPRSSGSKDAVVCPGCKATLKGIRAEAGERCSWCGFEFA
ncbi:MAG: hypothetical protein ACK4N5_01235 [Myxococcales bacterium]